MPNNMPKVYEGDEDYIFVNYARADRHVVLPIISALFNEGYRVWYDAGIQAGTAFPDYLADHIFNCECFFMFISHASLDSDWCNNEVYYAKKYHKMVLPIYLEDVELTRGLEIQIGQMQALFWWGRTSDNAFYKELFKQGKLDSCLTREGKEHRQTKRFGIAKAQNILKCAYCRENYVAVLEELRSVMHSYPTGDEGIESLINQMEDRIATEDGKMAQAMARARSVLDAGEASETSLQEVIAELEALPDKDKEIKDLIDDLNDRLRKVEQERIRREQEERRKAEQEKREREERLAREKAEREQAIKDARKKRVVEQAKSMLAAPTPRQRSLVAALADLHPLSKGDQDVAQLEKRLRKRLRSLRLRQATSALAVVAVLIIGVVSWPYIQSVWRQQTVDTHMEPSQPSVVDVPDVSISGLVADVDVKSGIGDYDWAELKLLSQAIADADEGEWFRIAKAYNLVDDKGVLHGDTIKFNLTDDTEAEVRILGFRHDDLADGSGKAGITFEFANVPETRYMNEDDTNVGGWKESKMREWLNEDFFARLPKKLRDSIVEVKKRTNNAGLVNDENDTSVVSMTKDKLWLLSATEVYGKLTGSRYQQVYEAEGTQYQLYAGQGVSTTDYGFRNKDGAKSWWWLRADQGVSTTDYGFRKKDGARSWWWLRSPDANNSVGFLSVDSDGDWGVWGADGDNGVSPGFCF